MEIFAKSDIGLVRSSNQDAYRFGTIANHIHWAIVCDGMGGANGGNVASEVAVETLEAYIEKEYEASFTKDQTVTFLTTMVQQVNSKLFAMQKENETLHGMGTTLELIFIIDETAHIVHVGDSRVYGVRGTQIKQFTTDHSVVQEMVDSGEITAEEARVHPNKNFITRALGVNESIHLDYIESEFKPGDTLLLCTDGLTNYVTKDKILEMVLDIKGEELADTLISTAKELGGADNITVAVLYA